MLSSIVLPLKKGLSALLLFTLTARKLAAMTGLTIGSIALLGPFRLTSFMQLLPADAYLAFGCHYSMEKAEF
jgi:hypothetical protein